jgi:hypothetical protein
MECQHDYKVVAYNSSIVIEECSKCGDELESDFDNYCMLNGFPILEDEELND